VYRNYWLTLPQVAGNRVFRLHAVPWRAGPLRKRMNRSAELTAKPGGGWAVTTITATSTVSPTTVWASATSVALAPGYQLNEGGGFQLYLPLVLR